MEHLSHTSVGAPSRRVLAPPPALNTPAPAAPGEWRMVSVEGKRVRGTIRCCSADDALQPATDA